MAGDWADRVERFWAEADATRPEAALEGMRRLVAERPPGDAAAQYEWASVHDLLGREAEAVPLYRAAIAAGLDEEREAQASVQLASSLRNVGDPEGAIALLRDLPPSATTGAAPQAFLALALLDAGRAEEALQTALLALAPTLPRYSRAVAKYAAALTDD